MNKNNSTPHLFTCLLLLMHVSAHAKQEQILIQTAFMDDSNVSFIHSIDLPKVTKPVLELWRGSYFGMHFGAGSGKMKENFSTRQNIANSVFTSSGGNRTITSAASSGYSSGTLTGSEADVFIGYNFHHPYSRLVWGGQLEGTVFDSISVKSIGTSNLVSQAITQSFNSSGVLTSTSVSDTSQSSVLQRSVNIQSMFSFLGRGGFLFYPNAYVYGLLGGTEANTEIPNATEGIGSRRNWWVLGWTTGAGLEYKITEHWSFLGEYRYVVLHYSLNWQNPSSSSTQNTLNDRRDSNSNTTIISTHTSLNLNLGKVGLIYRI